QHAARVIGYGSGGVIHQRRESRFAALIADRIQVGDIIRYHPQIRTLGLETRYAGVHCTKETHFRPPLFKTIIVNSLPYNRGARRTSLLLRNTIIMSP